MTSLEGRRPMDPEGITEDLLSGYLDDELDAPSRAAVEERLAGSARWRAVLDEVRETRGALRALPPVDGSPEFWARVLAGDAVVDLAAHRRARRAPIGWRGALVGVAAAVAVVVVAVALVPERDRVKPPVAVFADQHAARASLDNDAISQLASVGVPGLQR